tara:strand:+ start:822 stop:1352 length:531 start_codon:yes stop_codon:yes gene_type:complete
LGTFFFILYVLFIASVYLSSTKKQALLLNALCCISAAIYLSVNGGYAGVIASLIAATGSLFQLYMYRKCHEKAEDKGFLILKLLGSIAFAFIGISLLYQSPSDFLLIIAIAAARGFEMFNNTRFVKLGYALAEACWFVYAADNGYMGMYFVHLVMIFIAFYALYKKPSQQNLGLAH